MNKFLRFLPLLLGLVVPLWVNAVRISPQEALMRYKNSTQPGELRRMQSAKDIELQQTIGGLYVFGSQDGFLILPAYDEAPAVVGYSDSGRFSTVGNPALQEWLDFYNRELQSLNSPKSTNTNTGSIGKVMRRSSRIARAAVAPLIKTEWNQEAPYNMYCPKVNGHDVVTGCVATAMAQFIKYYNYPPKGKGRHAYYWEVGKDTLSYDYDTVPFQWDLMTDTYDSESSESAKEAVAQLMVACGISVDMHYDIGDSGAATSHMGVSLIDIFQYSPSLWMAHRDYYGYDEWMGMIYDDLAAGRPVLYSGQGTAGGHQFICDGFDGNGYFHFNWGWGGLSNGYFLLTALNPDDLGVGGGAGGFNTDQIATLGARPAESGDTPTYIVYNSGGFTPDTTTVSAGDDLRCGDIYFNYSMATLPDGAALGMKFTNADTDSVKYVRGPEVGGMHLDEGRYYDVVKFPELADGTYYITPALHADNKWWVVKMPLGTPDKITAVVKDGVATLSSGTDASITVSDIVIPDTIYANHDCPLSFTAYNAGNLEYYANITPCMVDTAGEIVATSTYRPMDVLAKNREAVNDYVANFTAPEGETLTPGSYSLVFVNASGEGISEPVTVYIDTTSVATEIKVSDFKMVTGNPVKDVEKVEFSFMLSCEAGVYYSCPRVLIFPGDGGYDLASVGGENHYLTAGQSEDVDVAGDLSSLEDGHYIAAVYADGKALSDYIRFDIDRVVTGVDEIENTQKTDGPIYNLNGVKCSTPLTPGLYIISGRLVLVR